MKVRSDTVTDQQVYDTALVWEKFIADGWMEKSSLRPPIIESWQRCYQADVDPHYAGKYAGLDSDGVKAVQEQNRELIGIAKPFMENLYEFVAGSGFVVALTDNQGYIMEVLGDADIMENPLTTNFFQGACWNEQRAGTNAIGMAVAQKKPIQVSGPEHYCRKYHCLTCSAAPILDARGRLLGVLDVSGSFRSAHLHTLGMVVAAAEAITAQLAIQQKNRELTLTNQRLTNIFNTMSDGVLVIDRQGLIVDLNPVAKALLGKTGQNSLGLPVEKVFGGKAIFTRRMLNNKESYVDVEVTTDISQVAGGCLASGEPIADETGVVTGGVIILRPIKKIQNLVNRFSGYYSSLQFSDIIGSSKGILEAIRVASLAATSSANVLLRGESGTGKEIFAQAIHNRSERRNGPFIAVNCGAIPRELIGSELFGYEEGAFTGARRGGKPGKFELAAGGTLFLDEIGDMPLEQQVSLLRVLQERKITRIGSDKVVPIDVRIICATNKNLSDEVERGRFRKDLYYRLNVISITIPPLRERGDDIVLLFNYFLEKLDKDWGRDFNVEQEVIDRILSYEWPGNVRELQNIVERIISLTEGQTITAAHLPSELTRPVDRKQPEEVTLPPSVVDLTGCRYNRRRFIEESERQEIMTLLSSYGGNVSLTARQMGVSRNTLYRKMKLYAIEN